ncbi:MAG: hypothetical protein A2046_09315 [Bacteroidetes bacterium GWA2_30_7]|nr:MAG: hypothetical protein QJ16_C0003G0028 [archaeon GW2011_AR1]MBS3078180.1 hypothetical protein [Candidatus Pacearchaeota archaeon]OFX61977.1 MAG: hypothetical protein A2046_09315 [Bacteroidetes bacterium GWA2_30_7]HIH52270.1 hypothetical protein [Nanoarchaeota archaeon]
MKFILKTGFGIKKIVLPFGKRKFNTIDETELPSGKIKVKKTNNSFVNNNWLIEQYKFCFYDKEGNLGSFLLGNPEGKNNFYVQEMRSLKSDLPSSSDPLRLVYEKAKTRLSKYFKIKRNKKIPFSCERNLVYLWNHTKNYLKERGIEKLLTQAEYEVVDTAEIDFKLGWQDVNKERKIEQYVGNLQEREKNYTILEKLTGTIYLERPLK